MEGERELVISRLRWRELGGSRMLSMYDAAPGRRGSRIQRLLELSGIILGLRELVGSMWDWVEEAQRFQPETKGAQHLQAVSLRKLKVET